MDHYRNPRNCKELEACSFTAEQRNSSCGDEVVFYGIVEQGCLVDVAFQGKGCVISQATASMLSERVKNMSFEAIKALDQSDINAMIGMTLGPVRMMCALLPLMALQKGMSNYSAQ